MSGLMMRAVFAATMIIALLPVAKAAGDPAAGKGVFQSTCSICHSVQAGQNKIGPTLFGVVGRKTGTVPGYTYSPQNQSANLIWDVATLDKYLQAPRAMIPGTKMTYAGMKDDQKRSDLIAYLTTLR